MSSNNTKQSWRQREVLKAQQQKEEALRKTETNFPTLVTTAHRIQTSAPQGFAHKADQWRVEQELKAQMDAYRKAKTARERRMILNTVFVFQRRTLRSDEDDDYEENEDEYEDQTLDEKYPPHGRRGTYGPVYSDAIFGAEMAKRSPPNPDGSQPTVDDFSEGWRLVTRLPFRPPRGELSEEQLHQMYLDRGNQVDDEDDDVNGDLTERNQRREFY